MVPMPFFLQSVVVVVGYGRCSLFMHSFFFLLGCGMAGRRCNLVNKNKQGHAMRLSVEDTFCSSVSFL